MKSNSLIKIHVDLPNHWMVGGESLWAKPVGENLYQIKNIPFFAYGLSYDDIVVDSSEAEDEYPEIKDVHKYNGHQTIRVIFTDKKTKAEHISVIEGIRTDHIGYEGWDDDQFTFNITPLADFDEFYDKLEELEEIEMLSFETCEECVEGSFDAEIEVE